MKFLEKLNKEQYTAVTTTEGPLLVLAGAGSGKTRVVTYRIIYLLQMGVPAAQILAVTFTNKAAQEMRERVHAIAKTDVLICTFHSLGLRFLRRNIHVLGYSHNFSIYDEEDVSDVLKTCFKEMHIASESEEDLKAQLKAAKRYISQAKSNPSEGQEADFKARTPHSKGAQFEAIFKNYQAKLKRYNAVDFDDLLYLSVKILQEFPAVRESYQNRWSHLLIDEYQDTNHAQYLLVKYLIAKTQNLCVVGDPDQSIYAWRGANIDNIMNFEKEYPAAKIIMLEQNYRSRSNILDAANALISHNELRYEKKLWSDRGKGDKITLFIGNNEKEEAQFIAKTLQHHHMHENTPWKQMVVFYRTHAQSRVFEDFFYLARLPYLIIGGISFYQRREIKDILAFLRMVQSGVDFLAFQRSINLPKRGLGVSTLEKLHRGANATGVSIFAYCESIVDDPEFKTPFRLSLKQQQGLKDYVQLIRELRSANQAGPLHSLVREAIDKSRYLEYLQKDPLTLQERQENLSSLIAKASEWELSSSEPALASFLEELSLKSHLDEAEGSKDRVHLMTIHNGKGLEYETVFLTGLEEGLFPHANAMDALQDIEEERRLCYVGLTRAKEHLYLSYARKRNFWGTPRMQQASSFLSEIPAEYIEEISTPLPSPSPAAFRPKKPAIREEEPFSDEYAYQEPFEVGDLVSHLKHGRGVIKHIYMGNAGLTFKILFNEDELERTLVAAHAHLKKL